MSAFEPTAKPENVRDEAGRGLGDALAISFRVLRWIFVLLLGFFLFSGVFTVDADTVAVRTSFGRIVDDQPLTSDGGLHFRWPRPIGEVYLVPTQVRSVEINDTFAFESRDPTTPLAEAEPIPTTFRPDYGFLLTGDKNIAYARYRIDYRVRPDGVLAFMRNAAGVEDPQNRRYLADNPDLLFQRADRLVQTAVAKAVVADTATRSIDDVRAGRAGEAGGTSPQAAIQAEAQAMLDELDLGLIITNVQRPQFTVPPAVRPAFEALNAALQVRSSLVEQGRADRRAQLTAAAGEAAPALLAAIEVYEAADARVRAAETPDAVSAAEADRRRAREAIATLLVGEPVGPTLSSLADTLDEGDPARERLLAEATSAAEATISGEAFSTVRRAETEGSSLVRQADSLRGRVDRLLPDYQADPERLRYRLTLGALQFVLTRSDADVELVPQQTGRLTVQVPPDAERRRLDQQRNLQRARQQQQGQPAQ